tara:strand:- start:726 stop:929 length:204 start_codon:yes stop_codon:yes gene_type:complete
LCLICIDFDKLTIEESIKNVGEMREVIGEDHYIEVVNKIMTRIAEKYDLDPALVGPMLTDYLSDNDF